MKNRLVRYIVTFLICFALAFILVWVAGVGVLFEAINPAKALLVFASIIAIVFSCIILISNEMESRIRELEKRLERLEKLEQLEQQETDA